MSTEPQMQTKEEFQMVTLTKVKLSFPLLN